MAVGTVVESCPGGISKRESQKPYWPPGLRDTENAFSLLLAQLRREVRVGHKGGVHLVYQFSIRLGLVSDALPFRIVLESLPVRGCGFTAGMLENIDKNIAFVGLIQWSPISNILHPVSFKEFHGVFAEAGVQLSQFP